MDWPLPLPPEMSDRAVSLRPYSAADSHDLFAALSDERAWEHIPPAIPRDAEALDSLIHSKLTDGLRSTFTIRLGDRVVGMTGKHDVSRQADRPASVGVPAVLAQPDGTSELSDRGVLPGRPCGRRAGHRRGDCQL